MKTAVIWTQDDCKYCLMAKQLLLKNDYVYIEKKIGQGNAYTKKDLLAEVPEARTVPQIFFRGKYIGGYEELAKILK